MVLHLTPKGGGNTDVAGAFICPADNRLEKQHENNFGIRPSCFFLQS